MKFNVGDRIVNNDLSCQYTYTNKEKGFVGEVVEVLGTFIRAKVLQNKYTSVIGDVVRVEAKYFKHAETLKQRVFKQGNFVKFTNGNVVYMVNDREYAYKHNEVGHFTCGDISKFDDDLRVKDKDAYNADKFIVEAYGRLRWAGDFFKDNFDSSNYTWTKVELPQEPTKEMTIEEIEKELGYKIKIKGDK